MKISEITKTFEFVIGELSRLGRMTNAGQFSEVVKECGLSTGLPAPRGGHYPIGTSAEKRLWEVARVRIETDSDLRDRVLVSSYLAPLKKGLASCFVDGRRPVDESAVNEILKEAKNASVAKMESRRFFFPVFCIEERGLNEFTIGPVAFERTDQFFKKHGVELERSIEEAQAVARTRRETKDTHADSDWPREWYKSNQDELRKYSWLASVSIENAEPEIGWDKAAEVVDLACSVLRLLIRRRDNFIGLVPQGPRRREARLSEIPGKGFEPWESLRWANPSVESGFWASAKHGLPEMAVCEDAITQLAGWRSRTPAQDRLIAGLNWFGEAWKESYAESRLVKFTICLEGLLTTGGREGLAETLAERAALLTTVEYDDALGRYNDAKLVYAARSKAVHGDAGRSAVDFDAVSFTAEELARDALIVYAGLCPSFSAAGDFQKALGSFFTALKLGGRAAAISWLNTKSHCTPTDRAR